MHPLTPEDPRTVGPHRLLARLGAGGMGEVYLARAPGGDLVAVKLVKDDLAHDPEFRARFAREVRAARRVRGPFTPAVVDDDTGAEVPWMATEYVPAPTLKEAVREHGPLPPESLPVLVSGLARALEAVHGAGLMHRDLKPGNVLLSPRGPQVIDFGLARAVEGTVLTRTGQTFGTPAYTSPEQIRGRDVSPASDVFSLAGTVLFAASGEPPFGPASAKETLRRVLSDPPEPGGGPGGAAARPAGPLPGQEPRAPPEHGRGPGRVGRRARAADRARLAARRGDRRRSPAGGAAGRGAHPRGPGPVAAARADRGGRGRRPGPGGRGRVRAHRAARRRGTRGGHGPRGGRCRRHGERHR
ncbi:serine/threonine-protein kinase [Nocardiopsis dassonvillei]